MIKGADKGSAVAVWDRENYIKEAENQLGDTNIYEEVPKDVKPLKNIILNTLENILIRGDVCTDTSSYFIIMDAKFTWFIFFQKFIEDYIMYQGGQLYGNVDVILRIFIHFWISIYNQLPKKSNNISKTLITS